MSMDHWTVFKDCVNGLIAIAAASVALWNYRKNANTRRAEFLVALHQAFFVDNQYKQMRRLLDSDEDEQAAKLGAQILAESEQLTDFLNFFELVAYLERLGTFHKAI